MDDRRPRGLTLPELLVTLALVGVLVSAAVPALQQQIRDARLRGAAQAAADALHATRAEAIRRNRPLALAVCGSGPAAWCLSPCAADACDCGGGCASAGAVVPAVDAADYPGTELAEVRFGRSRAARFSPLRGLARAGHLLFRSPGGRSLAVVVSPLGRVRLCSDDFPGYPPC